MINLEALAIIFTGLLFTARLELTLIYAQRTQSDKLKYAK